MPQDSASPATAIHPRKHRSARPRRAPDPCCTRAPAGTAPTPAVRKARSLQRSKRRHCCATTRPETHPPRFSPCLRSSQRARGRAARPATWSGLANHPTARRRTRTPGRYPGWRVRHPAGSGSKADERVHWTVRHGVRARRPPLADGEPSGSPTAAPAPGVPRRSKDRRPGNCADP